MLSVMVTICEIPIFYLEDTQVENYVKQVDMIRRTDNDKQR